MLPPSLQLVPWQIRVVDRTPGRQAEYVVKVIDHGDERYFIAWPSDWEELEPAWSEELVNWSSEMDSDLAVDGSTTTIARFGARVLGVCQMGQEAAGGRLWFTEIEPDQCARRVAELIDLRGVRSEFLLGEVGFWGDAAMREEVVAFLRAFGESS